MAAGLEPDWPRSALVVRRSLGARGNAVFALALGFALVVAGVATTSWPLALVGLAVLAAAMVTAVGAFGDQWCADSAGLDYRNRWLARGLFQPVRLPWGELESIRVWRGSVLILVGRDGRRHIVDGVERLAELVDLAVRSSGLEPIAERERRE